jgi:hypothetical protein
MKKHLKQFCDKHKVSRGNLRQWIDDLKRRPYNSMRLDRLWSRHAELLRAVAADYPGMVAIWRKEDNGWKKTATPGVELRPEDAHMIVPGFGVPSEEDEPEEDEWFWGKAAWQTRRVYADLADLRYRIPNNGTDLRVTAAANIPYMKIEGWDFVGFVYGEREPGEPRNPYMEPVRRMNGRLEYADWAVWRKT